MEQIGNKHTDAVDDEGRQRLTGLSPQWIVTKRGEKGFFKPALKFWGEDHGFKSRSELIFGSTIALHLMKSAA
jgi:hypothetical protein